jgi:hypothetical protein
MEQCFHRRLQDVNDRKVVLAVQCTYNGTLLGLSLVDVGTGYYGLQLHSHSCLHVMTVTIMLFFIFPKSFVVYGKEKEF